jgi:hypothetical protein
MKITYCIALILTLCPSVLLIAQLNPAISCWKVNRANQTGFGGFTTNVQQVQYSTANVYVSTNNVADWIPLNYRWPNNPWTPLPQGFVFKITLNPRVNNGNKIQTPYGHIGIWTNGVSIYNPKDAKSYLDSSVWYQNAYFFEHTHIETFDTCFGHPNNMREYHLHVNPKCLYNERDSTRHSPILGYAFDGFPIYGAYGYANADGTGGIKRMRSSYRLRNITDRTTLPNGTVLPQRLYGPTLSVYSLGAYMEDFEFVNNLGDLDQYNGRFTKTPEYPNGIYAYFVTIANNSRGVLEPVFPYVLGHSFYGLVQPGNTGPNSGKNTISEPVVIYTSVNEVDNQIDATIFPNPTQREVNLYVKPSSVNSNMSLTIFNSVGGVVEQQKNLQSAVTYTYNVEYLPKGLYVVRVQAGNLQSSYKLVVQ